ncbi:response regulator transcription factor [Paenibacillus humicola]|uniref:response regulator transcription factor n=1 Tax=Paenibacillus humicola TaxID=3110540 RepID=UPI00237B8EB4|nr:helix-turn-helix domain-containing protein [Paenibacillus humicola]
MQCLLIDDDIPTVEVLRDFIDWNGLGIDHVYTAHNFADAKALVERHAPDIVICDIEMPKGSGIDMIKWVRENHYDCAFLFFTCHESFEFASTAIAYDTDAYLIKPFDKLKIESVLRKTVHSLINQNKLQQYQQFGERWLKNKGVVEQSFWRDLLFSAISPRPDLIEGEIQKRDLTLNAGDNYYLVLASISKSEIEVAWSESVFKYVFANLTSEILLGDPNPVQVISYMHENRFCNAAVLPGHIAADEIHRSCRMLIRYCREFFRCAATCYVSESMTMDSLAQTRERLEALDLKNMMYRGKVHSQHDSLECPPGEFFKLDANELEQWFIEGEKIKIVNRLRDELEGLISGNKLDAAALHAVQQDFTQIVYAVLAKNKIYAHQLFADPVSSMMFKKSEQSVLDLMKWAAYITDKTVDYLWEIKQSESVVEKVKAFIHENYAQNLNRDSIAATVYLTPDYVAKLFRRETGMPIKDYLNEYRIRAAKELLLQSNESVAGVALLTGFDSISYFSTVFKKITGETPHAFRTKTKR